MTNDGLVLTLGVPAVYTPLSALVQSLQDLVHHHVESFNFVLEGGLQCAVEDIRPQELVDPKGKRMVMALEGGSIGYPTVDEKNVYSKSVQIFPSEVSLSGDGSKMVV